MSQYGSHLMNSNSLQFFMNVTLKQSNENNLELVMFGATAYCILLSLLAEALINQKEMENMKQIE